LITRLQDDGLEVQFLYLPKSTSAVDFTMFPWSRDISMAWLEVRKAAEAHKRNLNIFSSDPWHVFGVSSPTIQARIISGNSKALVKGVLHCDPKTGLSSVDQFKEYLKCEAGDPDWIVEGMMADSIPHYFSQHVSEGAVYWVDARTGASTWSHPHYLKYANLLKQARESKPHADIKSVACFQLSCLLSTMVPPLLSFENVQECARILRVSLQTEPFLAETVKAALRFFQQSLTTVTLSEFQARIERKKKLFSDLSRSVQLRSPDDRGTTTCIECEKEKASIHCTNCDDFFCHDCFAKIHATGARKFSHVHSIVDIKPCDECENSAALFHCTKCLDAFCENCFSKIHARGGRRNHIPVILRKPKYSKQKQQSSSVSELEKAKSPWIRLEGDESATPVYINVETNESRRDMPLSVINDF
jgi:hypothetical protein